MASFTPVTIDLTTLTQDSLNIPLSRAPYSFIYQDTGGGSEATGAFFFSQHLWGFFEVADLGYLSVFFNSTRIYWFRVSLCIFV